MDTIIEIEVYHPQVEQQAKIYVVQIAENRFCMEENELLLDLTKGTEFETEPEENGVYKIARITKASPFNTRIFYLSMAFTEAEYKVLGDELVKLGGYWQVDFGGIATVNLPKNSELDIDELLKRWGVLT